MTPPPPPLQIAILGAGQIGSAFAYYLSTAGHQVTLIARPGSKRLGQLQADNHAVVLQDGKTAQVTVADHLDEQHEYDLLLVTVPTYAAESVLPLVHCSAAKEVQFMFGTFNPERLVPADASQAQRYSLGFPHFFAWLNAEGRLRVQFSSSKAVTGSDKWAAVFDQAGLPCAYQPNMADSNRSSAAVGVAGMGVCYLAQQRHGGATWAECMLGARTMHEVWALMQRLGYSVESTMNRSLNRMPAWVLACILYGMSRNTAFRELLAGCIHEFRWYRDNMLKVANADECSNLRALGKLTQ